MLSDFINQLINNVVAIIFLMIVFLLFAVGLVGVFNKKHDDVVGTVITLFIILLLTKCVGL